MAKSHKVLSICALLLGTVNAFDAPAGQAFVSDLVARTEVTNAIALIWPRWSGRPATV